jgi:prephenate dehydrogenase
MLETHRTASDGDMTPERRRPGRSKPGLGLIGAGAFGAFCIPHLKPHFDVHVTDPRPDTGDIAGLHGITAGDLAHAAAQDIVVLAVPWRALEDVAKAISAYLKPGALVVEVCSIKVRPLAVLSAALPASVDIIGTHPLFGPQSGRGGIAGLNIAVCGLPGHDRGARRVARFLNAAFGLNVTRTSAEEHDRQMAYVQGLTHLIARSIAATDVPPLALTTNTWDHLMRMVETVRYDSDELFRTITQDNPFAREVRETFAGALAAQGPCTPKARTGSRRTTA